MYTVVFDAKSVHGRTRTDGCACNGVLTRVHKHQGVREHICVSANTGVNALQATSQSGCARPPSRSTDTCDSSSKRKNCDKSTYVVWGGGGDGTGIAWYFMPVRSQSYHHSTCPLGIYAENLDSPTKVFTDRDAPAFETLVATCT